MGKLKLKSNTALLRGQIAAFYEIFKNYENNESAERAKDLAVKLEKKEYSIAFCGHFSAGKSSMVNKIMGENILPSSPIPTSANLVKVKSGEDYAKVFFKEDIPHLYPAPYDYEKVKSYCKDGDQIEAIEISYSKTNIPNDVLIMDTPGIDSTDDAHRIATESALHLADLVFYVMDYNHVQGELNFLFTKELTEAGKEVYLVINQIDKHRDEELSFQDFQNGVRDSFASWGVKPAKIFYTSLKVEEHPYNQFHELRMFIEEKMNRRHEALPHSVFHSLKKLGEEHQQFLASKDEEKLHEYNRILDELPESIKNTLPAKMAEMSQQLEKFNHLIDEKEKQFYDEVDHLLDNAYLMPFSTRDLAEQYLAAREPGFKVGVFFTKQKTEKERQERLQRFFADLSEKVTSQIDWHMKELFIRLLKENGIEDDELMVDLQQFNVQFDKELLMSTVKEGARLSGEYLLNYTKDVTEAIKRKTKEQLVSYQTAYFQLLQQKYDKQTAKVKHELSELEAYRRAYEQLENIKERQTAMNIQLEQVITGHFEYEVYEQLAEKLADDSNEQVEIVYEEQLEKSIVKEPVKKRTFQPVVNDKKKNHTELESIVSQLQHASHKVKDLPGFKKIAEELQQKAERLQNQSFTVALFGAFSAGKSSFANALLGDRLLPVSPNPTTAAINKILPIDEKHPHGTVLVKLKSQTTLMDDINRSLGAFEVSAASLDDAIVKAKEVVEHNGHADSFEKTHLAFLHAFVRGIRTYRGQLGEVVKTDLNEFAGFVANEEQSCLVEWIEVYYDCALTRKGITLVDTPGADSINARHTGVAFEYIKNSDAILFVTYYNHAFSKADREFLIQLGRVKDTFALDKMFFIVNAIDLAHDEEEMHGVLDYVEDQLVTYGIRQPHLYPVSSLMALKEKMAGGPTSQSMMDRFEEHFYSFIDHDLRDIALNSAQIELQRVVTQLRSFITSAQSDEETKEQKRLQLMSEREKVNELLQEQKTIHIQKRLEQEIEELVFYIKQRVFLRYNDFLKEAFNPSLLKDDGRNLKKALQTALEGFLTDFGYDFAQELRATTLRIEAYIRSLLLQTERSIMTSIHEYNEDLAFSSYEMNQLENIDFATAFVDEDREIFKKAMSYFKNPKSFFEKNERKLLGDELENNLQQPTDRYLSDGKMRLTEHYREQLEFQFNNMLMNIKDEMEEYYQGALASLSNQLPIEQLKEIESDLTESITSR